MGKRLDFTANISDVKQINPSFSVCKVRIMYVGKNRNMTIFNKDVVERALPTLKNIPIVGEFSKENEDYKGHGGAIDLDSFDFIHTTKPYGVVPESATYSWEEVKSSDGSTREYLTIEGCYLWTGRYEEAKHVISNGKGQSMEVEITDGFWNEEQDAYQIDDFIFSALCILGDTVEPAFEEASISRYSLNDGFKSEFTEMLKDLNFSLAKAEEGDDTVLKELLEKYSLTIEDLTEKGIKFNEISEDELEDVIKTAFEIVEDDVVVEDEEVVEDDVLVEDDVVVEDDAVVDYQKTIESMEKEIEDFKLEITSKDDELETLRNFKLSIEKENHENEAKELFKSFQLTDEDVLEVEVNSLTIEEIREKCYAILGKKMSSSKNFSLDKDEDKSIKIDLTGTKKKEDSIISSRYGSWVE